MPSLPGLVIAAAAHLLKHVRELRHEAFEVLGLLQPGAKRVPDPPRLQQGGKLRVAAEGGRVDRAARPLGAGHGHPELAALEKNKKIGSIHVCICGSVLLSFSFFFPVRSDAGWRVCEFSAPGRQVASTRSSVIPAPAPGNETAAV